ncbi:MAG: hypothetical protein M3Z27_01785 [Actinomycetota bacterium]|nr:hypothetical protein [Actinomycetota bacterium]
MSPDGSFLNQTRLAETPSTSARRRRAVEAYCTELCAQALAARATEQSLAAFLASAGAEADDGDLELLRVTRTVAAEHTRESGATASGTGTGDPRGEVDATCAATPGLVAACFNQLLDEPAALGLEQHLQRCPICQAQLLRAHRAERVAGWLLHQAAPPWIVSLLSLEAEPPDSGTNSPQAEEQSANATELESSSLVEPLAESTATLPETSLPPAASSPSEQRPTPKRWLTRRRQGAARFRRAEVNPKPAGGYTPHPHWLQQRRRHRALVLVAIVLAVAIIVGALLLGRAKGASASIHPRFAVSAVVQATSDPSRTIWY